MTFRDKQVGICPGIQQLIQDFDLSFARSRV